MRPEALARVAAAKGSLAGRAFVVKRDRASGQARTPWAVYERVLDMDWKVVDFLTLTEATRLGKLLESMGAAVSREERG